MKSGNVIFLALITLALVMAGCSQNKATGDAVFASKETIKSDICNTAAEDNSCEKLSDIGPTVRQDCCQIFGKCC